MFKFLDKLKTSLYAETYFSDREAVVENVKRIIEANEICIRLSTHMGETSIWGNKLIVLSCIGSRVKISGQITSCEFIRRSKDVI